MWKSKKKQRMLKIKNNHEAWDVIPAENIINEIKYNRNSIMRNKKPIFQKKIFLEKDESTKQVTKK